MGGELQRKYLKGILLENKNDDIKKFEKKLISILEPKLNNHDKIEKFLHTILHERYDYNVQHFV